MSRPYLVLLLAGFVACLPVITLPILGDLLFQEVLIECYGKHFWQGDLYPRWCEEMQGGYGAPIFLFYPPLAFFISSLVYPLTFLGAEIYTVFSIAVSLSIMLAGVTCYRWLKEIVTPGCALLAAVLYIFLPYRAEVTLFRVAYAESWAMALMPLAFLYVRRLINGELNARWKLMFVLALLMLCHLPATFVTIMICGLYVLLSRGLTLKRILHFSQALLLAALLTAFYLLPGWYYKQFTYVSLMQINMWGAVAYANAPLDIILLYKTGQLQLFTRVAITWLILLSMAVFLWTRQKQMPHHLRNEYRTWLVIGLISWFLLIPASAPVYQLFGPLQQIAFPWRMQLGTMSCFTVMLALIIHTLGAANRKTWRGDYAMALFFMMLLFSFSIGLSNNPDHPGLQWSRENQSVGSPEYRTQWTKHTHLARNASAAPQGENRVQYISGKGSATIRGWSNTTIELDIATESDARLRIDRRYFPIWRASSDNASPVSLTPEKDTGIMLLDVPAGTHRIIIERSIWEPMLAR